MLITRTKKIVKEEVKGGNAMIDAILANLYKTALLIATILLFYSAFSKVNIDSKIGVPSKNIAQAILDYKNSDKKAEYTFKLLDNKNVSTWAVPLMYDETGDFLYPKGDKKIKIKVGSHGPVGAEYDYAYICMDFSEKNWNEEQNKTAEKKFETEISSVFRTAFITDGKVSSFYSSSSAAQSAVETDINSDGIICLTKLSE